MKSDKMLYLTYTDIQSLVKKSRQKSKKPRNIFNSKNKQTYYCWIFNGNYLHIFLNIENKHNLYREEDYHAIHRYAKYKYMKDHGKNKEQSYLKDGDVNNFYGYAMPQKLPVKGFEWVEDISEFDESFIKRLH